MLKALRHNTLLQIAIILIAIVLLWVRAFLSPMAMDNERFFSPLYGVVQGLLIETPKLAAVLGLLLMVIEAVWFNIITANNKLSKVNWLMPTLFYILAISWSSPQQPLTPMLLAWLPLIAAIRQILSTGNTDLEVDKNFNAAFFVGIAILFYLPVATYIVPLFLMIVTYKSYRWRDFLVATLGLSAPLFLLFVYAFLVDKLDYYFILIRHDFADFQMVFDNKDIIKTIVNIIFIILLGSGFFSQLTTLNDTTIQQRINTVILLLPIVAAVLMLAYDTFFPVNTQYAAIPFAFLTSNLIATERKRPWVNEVLFWILFLTPIVYKVIC